MFARRYATPVVVPPTVAIIAAGKGRLDDTAMGGFESHKVIHAVVTFDHRAATGGGNALPQDPADDLALPLTGVSAAPRVLRVSGFRSLRIETEARTRST